MERLKTNSVATKEIPTHQNTADLAVVANTRTKGAPKKENITKTAAVAAAKESVLFIELFWRCNVVISPTNCC